MSLCPLTPTHFTIKQIKISSYKTEAVRDFPPGGEGHVKVKAEIGARCLHTKEGQGFWEPAGARERGGEILLLSLQEKLILLIPYFRLPASRNHKRIHFCCFKTTLASLGNRSSMLFRINPVSQKVQIPFQLTSESSLYPSDCTVNEQ